MRLVFAKTPYDPQKPSVEAVLDSSRYFVIRLEDEGKKAYIGMGFAERTDSFDFSKSFLTSSKAAWLIAAYSRRLFARLHKVNVGKIVSIYSLFTYAFQTLFRETKSSVADYRKRGSEVPRTQERLLPEGGTNIHYLDSWKE